VFPFALATPPLAPDNPLSVQVLILPNFNDFPSDAITVEFWMNSIDTCRPGVPFSYAHGEYEKQDNSFLIFNYNSFGVSVASGTQPQAQTVRCQHCFLLCSLLARRQPMSCRQYCA
jgi:hypothetical protein